LAALRETYSYNLELGFPVAAGTQDSDEPVTRWRAEALAVQEKMRLNLRMLKRRGKWNFVHELQPLAPRRLAAMVREDDMGGIVDYFMPVPDGVKGGPRSRRAARSVISAPPRARSRTGRIWWRF
jgi:arachidonate 15-lipoxygenase